MNHKKSTFAVAAALALLGGAAMLAACSPTTAAVGAGATVGATAVQDRGVSGAASDTWIRAEINQALLAHSGELYLDVHLQVQNGRVLLSGTVPTPEARVEAVRIAWLPDGVREVINEMEVSEDGSFADYARDRWIEARLRAKLLGDKDVNSLNVSIESVNQSVYLIGVVHSEDELARVVGHAKNVPYVRRVVSYLTLKPDSSS
ncbi:MAG: BON domain-containing protein [Kiloniellales bacterium]|nr:BON domain-containing protein [Kiloniellales bacterium]